MHPWHSSSFSCTKQARQNDRGLSNCLSLTLYYGRVPCAHVSPYHIKCNSESLTYYEGWRVESDSYHCGDSQECTNNFKLIDITFLLSVQKEKTSLKILFQYPYELIVEIFLTCITRGLCNELDWPTERKQPCKQMLEVLLVNVSFRWVLLRELPVVCCWIP